MAKRVRQVIKIDEDLCNGCGMCVPACAEGALQVIDGKAKLVSDRYCDGLGACLGECPRGAISFEEREAEEFDEQAAMAHVKAQSTPTAQAACAHHDHSASALKHSGFVCPSARVIDRTTEKPVERPASGRSEVPSELRQWPVKLYLVNPSASYFENADLLVAADCVPFAYGAFHPEFLRGKTLVTGCPKFDDTELYAEKLTEILRLNSVKSVTVLQMEVPCCSGMLHIAREASIASGRNVPVESVVIGLDGEIKSQRPAA